MTDPTRTRRSFRPTPAWLIYGLFYPLDDLVDIAART
jgi:hypothetical protein